MQLGQLQQQLMVRHQQRLQGRQQGQRGQRGQDLQMRLGRLQARLQGRLWWLRGVVWGTLGLQQEQLLGMLEGQRQLRKVLSGRPSSRQVNQEVGHKAGIPRAMGGRGTAWVGH